MTDAQIPLDPAAVARRASVRYQRLIGDLVEEVAQLTAYAQQLEQELAAAKAAIQTAPKPDAWGDPERKDQDA